MLTTTTHTSTHTTMKKLLIRTLSGAIYVALVVFAIYSGRWMNNETFGFCFFAGLFFIVAMIGMYEVYNNLEKKGISVNKSIGYIVGVLVFIAITLHNDEFTDIFLHNDGFSASLEILIASAFIAVIPIAQLWRNDDKPFATIGYTLLPILWVIAPLAMLPMLKEDLMLIFICIWVNDTFAYLTGNLLGRHKMWPRHSPNKTWEGTFGGFAVCVATSFVVGPMLTDLPYQWWDWLTIGVICSCIGTLGDLVESMFKRSCGVKDSGNIMPGHGGILDRFDSLLMVTPFIVVYYIVPSLIDLFHIY